MMFTQWQINMTVMTAYCVRWTAQRNTNVENAQSHTAPTLSACFKACGTNTQCTGVDYYFASVAEQRCKLQLLASAQKNVGTTTGVYHYPFHRNCPGNEEFTDLTQKLHSEWCPQHNHVCQVSNWNLHGLRFYRGGQIFDFPIDFSMGSGHFSNSAALMRCLWWSTRNDIWRIPLPLIDFLKLPWFCRVQSFNPSICLPCLRIDSKLTWFLHSGMPGTLCYLLPNFTS